MKDKIIADKKPMVMKLDPGTVYWCRCGRSKNQPYCDGAHKGTGINPMKVEITESKKYALCLCKATCNEPFCDGSHKKL